MTRASLPLFIVMLAAVAIAACADRAEPRFPHRVHLAELECGKPGKPDCLTCNACHAVSKRDRAHKLPEKELCARCHRDDAHDVMAVLGVVPERVSGRIHFDHDQHLWMGPIQGQCVGCHAGVVEPRRPTLPPMKQCFSCHEHEDEWKRAVCTPCHVQADLERTMPQTFLRHDAGFARRHGTLARENEKLCRACHSQASCDDCHDVSQNLAIERRQPERIEREFVHRGDFMTRHAIEAESQPSRCMRCHTVETCDACHVARGVSGNAINPRNPHPPGWVGTARTVRSLHAREARRDIVACASCHDQGPATNCIRCHKVGAYGGNPHPAGFKSLQRQDSGMCRYCHE